MTTLSLRGVRILIVEDSFVLADSLRYLLAGYGAEITALAPSVEQAFTALEAQAIDVAVLDVNLGGTSVVPFAEHLRAIAVPFVFVTGYGDDPDLLPPGLRDCPRLEKPVDGDQLARVLLALTTR